MVNCRANLAVLSKDRHFQVRRSHTRPNKIHLRVITNTVHVPQRGVLIVSLQTRLNRTVRISTIITQRPRYLFRLVGRLIFNSITLDTLRTTDIRRPTVKNRHRHRVVLVRMVRRVRVKQQSARRRRQFAIERHAIGRNSSFVRLRSVLIRRRATTFTTTTLRNLNGMTQRKKILIRIPYQQGRNSTSALSVQRSRVARQRGR